MAGSASLRAALLTFASVLSGTVLIPTVRPLCAALYPTRPGAAHAFLTAAVLGGAVGAPALAAWADRRGGHARLAALAALVDALLLIALVRVTSYPLALALRAVQGAAAISALALIMGARPPGAAHHGATLGASLVIAVAVGSPIGLALLSVDPRAALLAGAALELAVAAAVLHGGLPIARRVAGPRRAVTAAVTRAALWVGAERLAVGAFVVTFAIWCHEVRHLGDRHTGALVTCFVATFAAATYPLGRLADRAGASRVARAGLAALGMAFLALTACPTAALPVLLALAGVASGAAYGAAMGVVVRGSPAERAATAMGVLHAAGSAGMLLGTAGAGVLAVVVRHHAPGASPAPLVFAAAAIAQLAVAATTTDELPQEVPCPRSA
jgi:MFS family permease